VWITVEVYESDASRVREGTVALVAPRSLRGEVFRGRVTYAGGVVDTLTHTVKIRVAVANRGLKLRPGMYAEVQLETPVAVLRNAQGASVAVPDAAVQDVNGKSVVFVPGASPGQFIARVVRLAGPSNSGTVTVTAGLQPGDKVVSTGAFQLKAELTKSSFGESER
jgi:cobalt-zinc-cadmium efflux system membrane fusion protein